MKENIAGYTRNFSRHNPNGDIYVTGFDDKDLVDFVDEFLSAEQDPSIQVITVWVSSYGGQVYNCLAMIDIVNASKKPVMMCALGKAMSAGAILLMSGHKGARFASENTTIMIHTASGGAQGKTEDVLADAIELKRLDDMLIERLAKNTNKKLPFWRKMFKDKHNTDITFTAQEALKLGMIDKVGIPKAITRPQVLDIAVVNGEEKSSK